jgi:hypothetical protein
MALQAQDGGTLTGTATIRDEGRNVSESYTVENGTVVGSRIHLELAGSGRRFLWDLRATGSALVGSFQQTNTSGAFISHGAAEWRNAVGTALEGTWAASYADVFGTTQTNTQFVLLTITRPNSDATLAGNGALRFPGEASRRLFTMEGDSSGTQIRWTWLPTDFFGDTEWRLVRGENRLFGTYTNFDSAGDPEYRGHAVWYRVNRSDQFSQ